MLETFKNKIKEKIEEYFLDDKALTEYTSLVIQSGSIKKCTALAEVLKEKGCKNLKVAEAILDQDSVEIFKVLERYTDKNDILDYHSIRDTSNNCSKSAILKYYEKRVDDTTKNAMYRKALIVSSMNLDTESFINIINQYPQPIKELKLYKISEYIKQFSKKCSGLATAIHQLGSGKTVEETKSILKPQLGDNAHYRSVTTLAQGIVSFNNQKQLTKNKPVSKNQTTVTDHNDLKI